MTKPIVFALLSMAVLTTFACSQDQKRPSPPAQAQCKFSDGKSVKTDYSSPRMKGRKVYGGLVPYGQVWRAGANENTVITFSDPVTIEGQPLDKGTYGLHMIPGQNQWTVIFSKNSTSWGAFTYKQDEDALRVTVKPRLASRSTRASWWTACRASSKPTPS